MMIRWLLLLLVLPWRLSGATYYVATNGNNGNAGTLGSPWATIDWGVDHSTNGDIVRVQAGVYNEQPTITSGGSNGAPKIIVADGQVVCRGFILTSVSYVKVIGFEITHTNLDFNRGIELQLVCSNIEIIDNYIHDIEGFGIFATFGSTSSYITVRGNRLYYLGNVPAVGFSNHGIIGIANDFTVVPHHWLAEYNVIQRSGDFINLYGSNIIVRNNYLHDYADAYWTNAPNVQHSDMFQPGSDGFEVGTRDQLIERNFCGNSIELNSHFGLWQDTVEAGDTNILIRGNVAFKFGSGGLIVFSTDHVATYNNTFYKTIQATAGYVLVWSRQSGSADDCLACSCINTLISDYGAGPGSIAIRIAVGAIVKSTNNLGYLAGTDASFVSTSDPQLVDPENRDFRLQSGSPAVNKGTNVAWVTSSDGSGTSFNVNDGQLFNDGWGMTDGDTVTVGGVTTRIASIAGNAITVSNAVTWTNGMPVYWGTDTSPDIGALPFEIVVLTQAVLEQNGTTYTATPNGAVRGVWFYVDGIPTTWDSVAPFTTTSAGTVTAKAYSLYASETPVVTATPAVYPVVNANRLNVGQVVKVQ